MRSPSTSKASAARMRRALLWLVVAAGGLALLWGGARLQGIFVEERDAAHEAIEARRAAIERSARVALERDLRDALERARPRIDAALADPLLEEPGLLRVEDGQQLLPRVASYHQGTESPAADLLEGLAAGRVTGDGPWGERLALVDELEQGVENQDDGAIAKSVRAFLDHQSRFVIPVTKDLPLRIYFLETFVDGTAADRSLLEALLRDGLRGTRGRRLEGLQPALLAHRERFTRSDFELLAQRLESLCLSARVVYDDFAARAADGAEQPLALPETLDSPALVLRGAYFAAPVEVTGMRGVAVDLGKRLDTIEEEMRAGGLIARYDVLTYREPLRDVVEPDEVPVIVQSAALAAEAEAIDQRYALKTATGVALGALVAGVALLVSLLYRRERKFLEAQVSFLSTVSHELRTPIASLRLMGETLERRLEGTETARDFPSRIVGEADRLSFLVENVLSFNRLEKKSVRTHLQDVTVAELTESCRADAAAFTNKPVHLRIDSGGDVAVRADADLARLLFSNLVSNACKYNQRESVEITIEAKAEAGRVVVQVTDNGIGVPKNEWDAIFTEFTRAKNRGAKRGFGLGLALCRRIMELHDGSIRVKDSSDAGTTFEMIWPAESEKRGQG